MSNHYRTGQTDPSTATTAASVTQIASSVWRVIVPDTTIYLTPPPERTSRYLVGRVEWLSGPQRFRVTLDEVRVEEADGRTYSLPVYLQPGTAEVIRETLALVWMRRYTEPGLYSNTLGPVSGSIAGRNPLPEPPAAGGRLDHTPGPGDSSQTPQRPRKRGGIRSPLSPLVSRRAAEQATALEELDQLIESLADSDEDTNEAGETRQETGETGETG